MNTLKELLKEPFDFIVDFMLYDQQEFQERYELLLSNTVHYIFLSSYRVYAGTYPITERIPYVRSTDSTG